MWLFWPQDASLLYVGDVVLLALSDYDFQCSLGWFVARGKAVGTQVRTSKSEVGVLYQKMVDCSFQFLSEPCLK